MEPQAIAPRPAPPAGSWHAGRVQTEKRQKVPRREHTQELPRIRAGHTRELPLIRAARGTRRLAVAVGGGTLVVAGVGFALFPMVPGGLPLILVGLTVLSLEFHWARRLLFQTRARLGRLRKMRKRARR